MNNIRKAAAISCAVLIGASGGAFAAGHAVSVGGFNIDTPVGSEWTLAAVGNLDGADQDDLLWRHQNGQPHFWKIVNGNLAGSADIGSAPGSDWFIRAAGDVDGDGDADIIWQNTNTQVHVWTMQGGQRVNGYDIYTPVGADWTLAAAGDVDGDDDDDIIWRDTNGQVHVWRMQDGRRVDGYNVYTPVDAGWTLAAAGDVDGDGDGDLIWRFKSNGLVHIWPMQDGQRVDGYDASGAVDPEWNIKGSGDIDGDGTDDIVWRHDNGQAHYWKMGPAVPPQRKTLKLVDLFCAETTDVGEDEVYLNITVDGVATRFPAGEGYVSINEDSDINRWSIGAEYTGESITVEVREDDDGANSDDLLGSVTVSGATANGTTSAKLTEGDYTLTYAVEDTSANATFTMVVMSDPQYYYCQHLACQRHVPRFTGSLLEGEDEKLSTQEEIDANGKTNTWHSQSIEEFSRTATNFKGVIVNGDITNVMDDDQLDNFRKDYQNKFTVYPGLGNHDYENYTPAKNDSIWCEGPGIATSKHYCLKEMMDYLAERVRALPAVGKFDLDDSDTWARTGSWSYYFDIGDYRFIQLNNHPAYEMEFSVFMSDKVGHEDFKVTSSMNWLEDVLNNSAGKKVVLNMHAVTSTDSFGNGRYDAARLRFQKLLGAHSNVVAIFAGHLHDRIGDVAVSDHGNSPDRARSLQSSASRNWSIPALGVTGASTGRNVPIFYGGSAMFNMYLNVEFATDKITVRKIDSENGTVVEFGAPVVVNH